MAAELELALCRLDAIVDSTVQCAHIPDVAIAHALDEAAQHIAARLEQLEEAAEEIECL